MNKNQPNVGRMLPVSLSALRSVIDRQLSENTVIALDDRSAAANPPLAQTPSMSQAIRESIEDSFGE